MNIDDIANHIESLGGVLTLRPGPGDGTPEIAWGDLFFYYAPDGVVPKGQPFATIVTKDYPGEPVSGLAGAEAFRVNIDAGRRRDPVEGNDPTVRDKVLPHPVYAGWISVVEPGPRVDRELRTLLTAAHNGAARRWHRRNG